MLQRVYMAPILMKEQLGGVGWCGEVWYVLHDYV